jgi:imidazole glycerol-phosphate synthase subunit HisF
VTLATRVIPCLDVADGRVVKGVRFEGLVDAGDPVESAARYAAQGADEITFLDVTATVEGRGTMLDTVRRTAEQVFVPLTVGGGVRSVADVDALLKSGADKIGVNSAAIARPQLLAEIADRFGAQVCVLSLDVLRDPRVPSGFVVTTHGGRTNTGIDALDWAERAIALGAGELLVNSIDADGTKAGYDVRLIEAVRAVSSVPVIASGGAGALEHFVPAVAAGADAVLAASVFHRGVFTIGQVKAALAEAGVVVRETGRSRP